VVLVPQAAIVETLQKYHDAQGHYCANTVIGKIRANNLYWPTMAVDVARYLRSCEICQPTRHGRGDPAPDELTPTPEAPWSVISIDLCSFDEPEGTYQAILVCDMFTRYVELRITQSKEAEVVMDALEDMWFMRYLKRPRKVLTDKGTEFNFLEPFRAQFNFEWSRISPGNAQANGMVERANGTFIDGIRRQRLQDPGCTFKQAALRTQLHYNNRVHSSTGFTPMYLQLGLTPDELPPADFKQRPMTRVNLRSKLNQLARERSSALAKAWDDAFVIQQSQKERRQELNQAKHANFEPFPLGTLVKIAAEN
jgi:transposase InsO family protein